jgi:hypothetical protein
VVGLAATEVVDALDPLRATGAGPAAVPDAGGLAVAPVPAPEPLTDAFAGGADAVPVGVPSLVDIGAAVVGDVDAATGDVVGGAVVAAAMVVVVVEVVVEDGAGPVTRNVDDDLPANVPSSFLATATK